MKHTIALAVLGIALVSGQVFAQEAAEQPPKPKWTGNVSASATSQSGNTERTGSTLAAEASKKSEITRISLKFLNNYAEEQKTVTTRNTYGIGKYDYFFSKAFYASISLELYNDQFKNLQLRTTISPGVGYQIWNDDIKTLFIETGIARISENLRINDANNEDKSWTTGRIAANATYKVSGMIVLSDQLVYYPSFQEENGSKLRNEASASSALGSGWAFKLTNIIEQNSKPPTGVEKTDMTWILGLQYNF